MVHSSWSFFGFTERCSSVPVGLYKLKCIDSSCSVIKQHSIYLRLQHTVKLEKIIVSVKVSFLKKRKLIHIVLKVTNTIAKSYIIDVGSEIRWVAFFSLWEKTVGWSISDTLYKWGEPKSLSYLIVPCNFPLFSMAGLIPMSQQIGSFRSLATTSPPFMEQLFNVSAFKGSQVTWNSSISSASCQQKTQLWIQECCLGSNASNSSYCICFYCKQTWFKSIIVEVLGRSSSLTVERRAWHSITVLEQLLRSDSNGLICGLFFLSLYCVLPEGFFNRQEYFICKNLHDPPSTRMFIWL